MPDTPNTLPADFFEKQAKSTPETLPANFFDTAPDPTKPDPTAVVKPKMEPSFFGGAHPSDTEQARITKTTPLIDPFIKDVRKGATEIAGASIGGGAVAEGKGLLGAIMRALGVGTGGAVGNVVVSHDPKEALKTGGAFAVLEGGGAGVEEVTGRVAKKLAPYIKEISKSKLTKMAEEHDAEVARATAKYQEDLQAHKQNVKAIEQQHKESLEKLDADYKAKVEAHKQEIKSVSQKEAEAAVERRNQYRQDLKDHREKVKQVKAEYQAKIGKIKDAESLRTQQNTLATTVSENVQLADQGIRDKLGKEFEAVNDAVAKKNPTIKPLDVEREARGKLYLPDSVEAFNNVMEGLGQNIKSQDFGRLRMAYSKLSDVLYGGRELPADLYDALKTVRGSLKKNLEEAATSAGMGEKYKAAMKAFSEYMDDWHDASAISKGGSPISRILQAKDPGYVIDQFTGKAGERLMKTLQKYKEYGVDTELAGNLKDTSSKLKTMTVPKMPDEPTLPAKPGRPEASTVTRIPKPPVRPEAPNQVAVPLAPREPNIPPFDRDAAAKRLLAERLRKALVGGGMAGTGALLYHLLAGGSPPQGTTPVP